MNHYLSPGEVVNAACESTEKYFNVLRDNNAGQNKHDARNIHQIEDETTLFENEVYRAYRCEIPAHLRIIPDSSATFISKVEPRKEIQIWIKDYSRRNGQMKFITKDEVKGDSGTIIIDFRWLVKRCKEWFKNNGTKIPKIENIGEIQNNINLPFQRGERVSTEQYDAIETMLNNGLSYIWGPPGTGKTKNVLSPSVEILFKQKKKILVLSSTNLAVDNALTAILEQGIPKDKVARIGIPSPKFLEDNPECCEMRAFQQQKNNIESQIRIQKDNIKSAEKAKEIKIRISENNQELENIKTQLEKEKERRSEIERKLSQKQSEKSEKEDKFKFLEENLKAKSNDQKKLGYTELNNDITTLENDQIKITKELDNLGKNLNNIGLLSRLFTRKKQRIEEKISKNENHRESFEATLKGKRKKKKEIAPEFNRLQEIILELGVLSNNLQMEIIHLEKDISNLQDTLNDINRNISEKECRSEELSVSIENDIREISNIPHNIQTGNEDELISEWNDEIIKLKKQMEDLKQDLSSKYVLGMTLDGFIGMTLQMDLNIDHVFIDEAPYAPLAKVLPLLSLHCPISMLGDHFQIPPICEVKNDATILSYWKKRGIFLEDAFRLGNNWNELNSIEEPTFNLTKKWILTKSYRFGNSLASLLDRYIYNNIGLLGLVENDTMIRCIDCAPQWIEDRKEWQNYSEANSIVDKIRDWWDWAQQQDTIPSIAILCPYKNQCKLIYDKLRTGIRNGDILDHIEVWNTHKTQGREWDWVLFSVSDTGREGGNDTFLSDSNKKEARPVLNTTISRAKDHLIIFLDKHYWRNRRKDSLLTKIANL